MSVLVSRLAQRARTRILDEELLTPRAVELAVDEAVESREIASGSEGEIRQAVSDQLQAFGPLQPLLQDNSIEEIWINAPDRIFVSSHGVSRQVSLELEANQLTTIVERMLRNSGRRLDRSSPFVDASLPDGSRVHVVIPDITRTHWSVNIRKFPRQILSLADLVQLGSLTEAAAAFLTNSVRAGENILVSGATQAGKTTLLCALLGQVSVDERIVSVEETFEIRSHSRDWVAMQTRQPNLEGSGEVNLRRLVKESLRMRPGRIVVGEVREAESLDLLIALNSGLPGMCTIHANSAADAIAKLCTLPLLAGQNISSAFVNPTVASCIDLVVHCRMLPGGQRVVEEIGRVFWDDSVRQVALREIIP